MTFLSHPASQIRPQTVELNFVRFVALSAPIRTVLRQDLSADELAKVDRYLSVKAQDKALQVRFMLRRLLTEYVNGRIAPSAWCFDYGAKGKPCLSTEFFAATQIVFNLSHSGDWLLIGMMTLPQTQAISDVLLGVDIERARSTTDIYPILHHYFSSNETQALLELADEASQRERFFDLWALKESYIKATGLGLAQSLKSFAFEVSGRAPGMAIDGADESEPRVVLQRDICLRQLEGHDGRYWQSVLGRLNKSYRFAVSLGANEVLASVVFNHKMKNLAQFC